MDIKRAKTSVIANKAFDCSDSTFRSKYHHSPQISSYDDSLWTYTKVAKPDKRLTVPLTAVYCILLGRSDALGVFSNLKSKYPQKLVKRSGSGSLRRTLWAYQT
jgi:hypothetical protein